MTKTTIADDEHKAFTDPAARRKRADMARADVAAGPKSKPTNRLLPVSAGHEETALAKLTNAKTARAGAVAPAKPKRVRPSRSKVAIAQCGTTVSFTDGPEVVRSLADVDVHERLQGAAPLERMRLANALSDVMISQRDFELAEGVVDGSTFYVAASHRVLDLLERVFATTEGGKVSVVDPAEIAALAKEEIAGIRAELAAANIAKDEAETTKAALHDLTEARETSAQNSRLFRAELNKTEALEIKLAGAEAREARLRGERDDAWDQRDIRAASNRELALKLATADASITELESDLEAAEERIEDTTPIFDYSAHLGLAYEIDHGFSEGVSRYWDASPPTHPDPVNVYRITEEEFDHYEAEIAEHLAEREDV